MVFLDSNVWIYGFIESQNPSKHQIAKRLIEDEEIGISVQVIAEVCLALIRKTSATEDRIQRIIGDFEVQFHPLPITTSHLRRASLLRMRYNVSHWDSLLLVAALDLDASIFYSEDMQDGLIVDRSLTIQNPFR